MGCDPKKHGLRYPDRGTFEETKAAATSAESVNAEGLFDVISEARQTMADVRALVLDFRNSWLGKLLGLKPKE